MSCTIASVIGSRPMVDLQSFSTAEGLVKAQAFEAQRGDVVLSTFPKTGTTWLQQIVHQLRTGGHVAFDEITEEVPWLEVAPAVQMDLNMPQKAAPRCFKSHQLLSALAHLEPHAAKFICIVRDPEKTLISHFKFMHSHGHACATAGDINEFIKSAFTLGPSGEGELRPQFGGTLWDHYAEYWQCCSLPTVKVVVFEHLVKDLLGHLDGLNAFMELPPLDTERKTVVAELSHKDWMEQHDKLFDDHALGARINAMKEQKAEFTSVSKVGHEVPKEVNVQLNEESRAVLARMWEEKMMPVTGHSNYNELIQYLLCSGHGRPSAGEASPKKRRISG